MNTKSLFVLTIFVVLTTAAGLAQDATQQASNATLPNAPSAVMAQEQNATQQNSSDLKGKQTKRILGIVPNFRSVSADVKLPPESVKEKFLETTQDSFDYSSFIFVGILAGVSQLEDSTPEFHQGAAGYGRYYWHTFVDQADENYQVEFFLPAALHQDPRYYTLGHGGVFKRTAYAFSRVLITRTDAGGETFNSSEIVGAGAAAGISGLYYPSVDHTWTKTGQRWLLNVSLDGGTFIFKEFWPDINSSIFHQKY
ncbi:MAG: hypothetical protein WA708_14815 [Acidobacteriaceae bacterium]